MGYFRPHGHFDPRPDTDQVLGQFGIGEICVIGNTTSLRQKIVEFCGGRSDDVRFRKLDPLYEGVDVLPPRVTFLQTKKIVFVKGEQVLRDP